MNYEALNVQDEEPHDFCFLLRKGTNKKPFLYSTSHKEVAVQRGVGLALGRSAPADKNSRSRWQKCSAKVTGMQRAREILFNSASFVSWYTISIIGIVLLFGHDMLVSKRSEKNVHRLYLKTGIKINHHIFRRPPKAWKRPSKSL